MEAREHTQASLKLLREQLDSGGMRSARRMIHSLHPAEIARLLESVPLGERAVLWEMVGSDDEGDVLVEVSDEVRDGLIKGMKTEQLIAATEGMELDDLADLLIDLPETITQKVLQSLDDQDEERLRQVLAYGEDSAGGLMNVDIVTVRPDVTLEVVCRYLRARGEMPDGTDSIFVVDRDNGYVGTLYLSRLLTNDADTSVAAVMSTDILPIPAHTPSQEVVWEFEHRDLLSAPVVDDNHHVVGRITVDDVVDVIRDEAEHSFMSAAGLDEEDDMFAPVFKSASRRALWLGVNLCTAFLAAAVVDIFQTTVDKIVLLAVLMPVVPSMGGVAGSQSLTIITRAIALGQIDRTNARRILRKELLVGVLNGIGWSIIVAGFTYLWFGQWRIGGVIGAAMIINLIVAAVAGFSIPLALRRMNIDPALAGGVVLTTVTDVIGYMAFLGLGAAFLL
ncbi:MAG: magnesium transporter [Gammaproteobacteria bacterium]|nr:magnesium transporter [Gammaproteobacteria bacterium]MDH3428723.1 magnesium transporter [Gammaproteobacteria bacterium]MDH3435178.1 magnesium transporter [Gammaproteobacteria bacterium]